SNFDDFGVENRLAARDGRTRAVVWKVGPGGKRVKNVRCEFAVTWSSKPARLLKLRKQKIHAGVKTNEEGLLDQGVCAAGGALRVQIARAGADRLRGVQTHFKVDNLLLLGGSRMGAVAFRVTVGGIERLVRQVAPERVRIVPKGDFGGASGGRGFASIEHNRAEETQVGGRKRPAVHGNLRGLVAAVRIVHAHHLVVGNGRDVKRHADETALTQQAIGIIP